MVAGGSAGSHELQALQEQVRIQHERVFHVDHLLHQMQNQFLEIASTVKEQSEQLYRLDQMSLRMETHEMKVSSLKDDSDQVLKMEKQIKQHGEQLKQLQRFDALQLQIDALQRHGNSDAVLSKKVYAESDMMVQTKSFERLEAQVNKIQARLDKLHGGVTLEHDPVLDDVQKRLAKLESDVVKAPDIDILAIENFAGHQEYRKCEYQLGDSVEDLALLIGSGLFEAGASVVATILWIVNAMMQITFLVICGFFFVNPDINDDTVQAATEFRMLDAHHDNWLLFGSSLAQRLCTPDLQPPDPIALVVGGYQNAQLGDFQTYLKTDADGALERFFNGEMMCILSTACWVICVMAEMSACLDAILTLASFNTQRQTVIHLTSDGQLVLKALAPIRKAFGLLFLAVRFGIVCALTVFGCMWLGGTEAITDLLLNTVALGFILSIDEMLYAALIDERTKEKMRTFAPLKKAEWPSFNGFEMKNALLNLLGPLGVFLAFIFCNVPLTDNMKSVTDEMCKGDLNFTYSHDALTRVLVSSIEKQTGAYYTANLTKLSVSDKISGSNYGPNDTWTLYVDPANIGHSVRGIKNIPLAQMVDDINPSCNDLFAPSEVSATAFQYRSLLKQQLDLWVASCSEIKEFCLSSEFLGIVVRAMCSETCECNTPFSPVGSHTSNYGCPDACVAGRSYQNQLLATSCSDMTPYQLHEQTFWKSWAVYIESVVIWEEVKGIGDAMVQHGCEFHNHMPWSRLKPLQLLYLACRGELPRRMRPIAIACAATCRCNDANMVLHHDGSCAFGNRKCVLGDDGQNDADDNEGQ